MPSPETRLYLELTDRSSIFSSVRVARRRCKKPCLFGALVLLLGIAVALTVSLINVRRSSGPSQPRRPKQLLEIVRIPGLGTLAGVRYSSFLAFRGIRYGVAARWQAPRAVKPWTDVYNARRHRAACHGLPARTSCPVSGATYSEDCLFLNIFTPLHNASTARSLPVVIVIHGGENSRSCSNAIDGSSLASGGGVIVVTFNYRLQALGFLGGRLFQNTTDTGWNHGLLDQRLAFQWVQDHIAAFGGDSSSVTILGQNSGGASVLSHLVMPKSFGLYSSAIVESALPLAPDVTISTEAAESHLDSFQKAASCSTVTCLLELTALEVTELAAGLFGSRATMWLGASAIFPWRPVVDGNELKADIFSLVEAGQHNKNVAVILGTVRDEMASAFAALNITDITLNDSSALRSHLKDWNVPDVPDVVNLYSPQNIPYPDVRAGRGDIWWRGMFMLTDWMFVCPTRRLARAFARINPSKTFLYSFEHVVDSDRLGSAHGFGSLAYHAAELPFVFHCAPVGGGCVTGDGERDLAATVVKYWSSFVATGHPEGPADWPPAGTSANTILAFDVRPEHAGGGTWSRSTGVRYHPGLCDRWDEAVQSPRAEALV